MTRTAKAAAIALLALMSFATAIPAAYADSRHGDSQFQDGDSDDEDEAFGRKKPRFQTKFFSED